MNEAFIKQHVEQYKENTFMQIQQHTLLKYTGYPVVDEDRLFFTLLPLFNGEEWNESIKVSTIAVSLIYTALAAHELVREDNATSREQQLQVLAGDYYSGRYYQLLAKENKIDLIKLLSSGVTAVTEKKSLFYDKQVYTLEQLVQSIQIIESKPIEQFLEYYTFHEYVFMMKEALLLVSLKKELMAYEKNEHSFYLSKSNVLQSNINALQLEVEKMEQAFEQDIRSSELLKEPVKNAILERVNVYSLEKQLREG
ncbi:heptaprenyl diphosphate synthase component 1 [Psychrobacillus sp.]|uniref:heptaprenyl diphosphate synthase component 1 n=1 Tax=Psychrobacillus sp. TaxID=1871623 RepID=UPI0028BD732D|nr:heptaprenyl diphosphate synthase component 1 [Psychrobacillus sp.]